MGGCYGQRKQIRVQTKKTTAVTINTKPERHYQSDEDLSKNFKFFHTLDCKGPERIVAETFVPIQKINLFPCQLNNLPTEIVDLNKPILKRLMIRNNKNHQILM